MLLYATPDLRWKQGGEEEATEAYIPYVEETSDKPTKLALKYGVALEFMGAVGAYPEYELQPPFVIFPSLPG